MKLVFLYPNLTLKAGTERVIIDRANHLAEHTDFEIAILTYEHGAHSLAYPISSKIKYQDLNICFHQLYRYNCVIRFFKKLSRHRLPQKRYNDFISTFRPDIVTTVTYYREALKIVTRCPIKYIKILESHVDRRFLLINDPTAPKNFVTKLRLTYEMNGVNYYAKRFDHLVALTDTDANNWSKELNTTVITNMIHQSKKHYHSRLNNKRVIFAGRYAPEKGLFDLLKIWEIVFRKHPDWCLELYGEGPLYNDLIAEANRLNINVSVNKPVENIFEKYQEASIFVLSSVFESFGLVIPEAMSCGLPVVTFNSPFGPRHIITDGKDGFLIPNRNISLFASRICELIESELLRRKIGRAAIQSAERYSSEEIMPQWIRFYEYLLKQRETKARTST